MALLLIWILCGVGAAMIAQNKGKDGCGWFIIGMLFGPFGLLFALVSSPDAKRVEEQAIASGGVRKCPMCAELVKAEAVRCRFCGADLKPVNAPAAPDLLKTPPAGMYYCARCRRDRPIERSKVTVFGDRVCIDCSTA